MINTDLLEAARGLLHWSQSDLADAAGINKTSIALIERGKQNPSRDTLTSIEMAFDRHGVVFAENGVFRENRRLTLLDGNGRLLRLLDDIVLSGCREVLIDGAEDAKTPEDVFDRVNIMRAQGMTMRHLVCEGDTALAGRVEEYRWLPADCFVNQVIFTYGNNVAIASEIDPVIEIHRDANLARQNHARFELLWRIMEGPKESTAKRRYDDV